MPKTIIVLFVGSFIAALCVSACSGDDDSSSNSSQSSGKTCADLQACCAKIADADKKKDCQTVHDALNGVQNADLGCEKALASGYSKECP